jgi:hypothetical protein
MVTKGMWKVECLGSEGYQIRRDNTGIRAPQMKTELKERLVKIVYSMEGEFQEQRENAELIVTAVNQCKSINPDNPQAVAEQIGQLIDAIKGLFLVARPINDNCKFEFEKTYIGTFAVNGNRLETLCEVLAKCEAGGKV